MAPMSSSPSRTPSSLWDARFALAGLSAVFLFEMVDNSVLSVALPTIARDLDASAGSMQWVSSAYSLTFGGLMLVFGVLADRVGRRRTMLVGLTLLAAASIATVAVSSIVELIAVRAAMGVAAAMTTPGAMALAFRLFTVESLRIRALTVISTAGLIGLAVGPTVGGLVLLAAPWQVLLLATAPIAVLAFVGIRAGIPEDRPEELHRTRSLDVRPIAQPLVASGLALKAAAALATAGLSFLVTLQLQLVRGWSPALAAAGALPQVAVLLATGRVVAPLVQRLGPTRAAEAGAVAVVSGLVVFSALARFGYPFVVIALALVAAGMRVVGTVAGHNVLAGLPQNRTSVGAALVDTAGELATAVGVGIAGTILAAVAGGAVAAMTSAPGGTGRVQAATEVSGAAIACLAAVLVAAGFSFARRARAVSAAPTSSVSVRH